MITRRRQASRLGMPSAGSSSVVLVVSFGPDSGLLNLAWQLQSGLEVAVSTGLTLLLQDFRKPLLCVVTDYGNQINTGEQS